MLWMDILVGACAFIVIYFVLRLLSVNRMVSCITALILMIAAIFLTEVYVQPEYSISQHEKYLSTEYPLINYAAIHSPEEFKIFMDKVRADIQKNNNDLNKEIYYQSELLNALLLKYGPYASDESLYHFLQASVAYDKKLFAIDPALVLFHEFPEKFSNTPLDFTKINRDEYLNVTFEAMENVIKSGAENPRAVSTADETKQAMIIFREVVEALSQKYGAKVVIATLQNPNDQTLDKNTSAEIVMAFFEGIIAKGQNNAGLFMRVTLMLDQKHQLAFAVSLGLPH